MLETKYVFIDTQYFVKNHFNFSSRAFISLRELCQGDELKYLSTSVVEQEVEGKIQHSIKESLAALQSFKRKASILSTIEDEHLSSLFCDIHEKEVYEKASSIFHQFNVDCNYECIEADQIDCEHLLDLYFQQKPPFSNGKKKAEFPDAISLLSLESFLDDGERVYVISEDNDLKDFCKDSGRFISIESLEKLLDIYNQHTNLRTEQIKQYVTAHDADIRKMVSEHLSNCDVYNSSTWEDAEVESFDVAEVGDFEVNVVQVNDEECQLTFDVSVDIRVTVVGPDFINGIYDKEEGRMYTFESTTREEVILFEFTCELAMAYEFVDGNLQSVDWGDFDILNIGGGIEVDVDENSDPDWY